MNQSGFNEMSCQGLFHAAHSTVKHFFPDRWWFQIFLNVHPDPGKWSNLIILDPPMGPKWMGKGATKQSLRV